MELSIIIPVYNAERYIKECLESVIVCPIKEMECILVNDGSIDASETIIGEYAKRDNRLKVISKSNAGVSAARNTGLRLATGTYVMFLDADDYLDETAWKTLQDHIHTKKYEFVGYSYYTQFENKQNVKELFPILEMESENLDTVREYSMASSKLNTCWGKLFLLKIIKENNLQFRADLKIGEDYIFVSEYLRKVSVCLLSNYPILYYRQHESSAMKRFDMKTRLGYMHELYEYNKECVLTQKDHKLLSKMYIYYLRLITNLSLEFAKYNKGKQLKSLYLIMLKEPFIKEILSNVDPSEMPSMMKGMEFKLLKKHRVACLTHYFRIKAKFAN